MTFESVIDSCSTRPDEIINLCDIISFDVVAMRGFTSHNTLQKVNKQIGGKHP